MKKNLLLFSILFIAISQSQELKNFAIPKEYEKIFELKGDLDKDGNEETVMVFNTDIKTDSEGFERKFYILKNFNGNLKIWKENASVIINSKYGFYPTDNELDIKIKNNCLIISQLFFTRFQNGDFYLIGSKYQLDDTCEYNLSMKSIFRPENLSLISNTQNVMEMKIEQFQKIIIRSLFINLPYLKK